MNHPHNDPEDPSANECNYNFAQVVFAFCLGRDSNVCAGCGRDKRFQGVSFSLYLKVALIFPAASNKFPITSEIAISTSGAPTSRAVS